MDVVLTPVTTLIRTGLRLSLGAKHREEILIEDRLPMPEALAFILLSVFCHIHIRSA
jgi:hypothetical protein